MSSQVPKIAKYGVMIIFMIFFLQMKPVLAANHSINKFGIHLAQPQDEDIDRADILVNGAEGQWGYITLVIHEDDKKINK